VFSEKSGRADRAIFVVDKSGVLRWIKKFEPGASPDNAELIAELKKL